MVSAIYSFAAYSLYFQLIGKFAVWRQLFGQIVDFGVLLFHEIQAGVRNGRKLEEMNGRFRKFIIG